MKGMLTMACMSYRSRLWVATLVRIKLCQSVCTCCSTPCMLDIATSDLLQQGHAHGLAVEQQLMGTTRNLVAPLKFGWCPYFGASVPNLANWMPLLCNPICRRHANITRFQRQRCSTQAVEGAIACTLKRLSLHLS